MSQKSQKKPSFKKPNNNQTPHQKPTKQPSEKELADLFDLAIQAKRDGNFKLAISHYEKLKKLAPQLPSVYSSLAKVQILAKDYESASNNLIIATTQSILHKASEFLNDEKQLFEYRMLLLSREGQTIILMDHHNNCRHLGLILGLSHYNEPDDLFFEKIYSVLFNEKSNRTKMSKVNFRQLMKSYYDCNLSRLQGKSANTTSDFYEKYSKEQEIMMDDTYHSFGLVTLLDYIDWRQIEKEIHTMVLDQHHNSVELKELSSELDNTITETISHKNTKKDIPIFKENTSIDKSIGRNEPCPCGSKLKYKSCCGKLLVEV